jgi:hypothetical protein
MERNNFPADYTWSVNSGDHLGDVIKQEILFYNAFEGSGLATDQESESIRPSR